MKTAVIIGAASGIGRALSLQMASKGYQVVATYHEKEAAPANNISYHYLDVLNPEADLSFLPEKIDAFAYCVGAIELKPFHRLKWESFAADYDLQVGGAVRLLQAALPGLKASEEASIVLFSTVAVQQGFTFHAQVSSSKGAIEGLARALAAEWAPNIRVNVVAPSLSDTPLAERLLNTDQKKEANAQRNPLKMVGEAVDSAAMAAFLLSNDSKWISGQVMSVDGGMSRLKT